MSFFSGTFFYNTPNRLSDYLPGEESLGACLRLIEVSSYRADHYLELVMDDEVSRVVAYLSPAPGVVQARDEIDPLDLIDLTPVRGE